jgi:amino acid transporter
VLEKQGFHVYFVRQRGASMIEPFLAEASAPVIDTAWVILLISRVLHTASAAIILGGLAYLKQVVAPLAEGSNDRDEALYRGRRTAWARLVMICTALLLLSGFFNLYTIMVGNEDLPPTYHMLFGIKFLLAMFVFFVAAGTAGASPMAVNMRASLHQWLSLALLATMLIFVLGAAMRTYDKVPRQFDEPAEPIAAASADQ